MGTMLVWTLTWYVIVTQASGMENTVHTRAYASQAECSKIAGEVVEDLTNVAWVESVVVKCAQKPVTLK